MSHLLQQPADSRTCPRGFSRWVCCPSLATLLWGLLLSLFLLGGLAGAPLKAQDWPAWRGPSGDGSTLTVGDSPLAPDASDPVAPGRLTLRPAWTRQIGSGYAGLAAARGRLVTMASQDGTDWAVCLDAATSEPIWRHALGPAFPGVDGAQDGPTSTPLIDENRVYALSPRGLLVALDLETGREMWSQLLVRAHNAVRPKWGFTTSPIVEGPRLIVLTGGREGNAVTAFDKNKGSVLWTSGNDIIEYQSPVALTLSGRRQIVYSGNSALHGLDPSDGTPLWTYRHQGSRFYRRIINPLQVGPDTLLIKHQREASILLRISAPAAGSPSEAASAGASPAAGGRGWAVEKLWESGALKLNYNIPVVHEGYVYGHNGSFLTCLDLKDGSRVWRSRPPGNGFLILVDGYLAVLSKEGSLHLAPASPEGYSEAASLQVFDRLSWTPPIYAQGRFFVRDSFSQVAAVDVREAAVQASAVQTGSPEAPPGRAADAPAGAYDAQPREVSSLPQFMESEFGRLIERAGRADVDRRKRIVEDFLSRHETLPLLEEPDWAHFLYYGPAQDMALRGDMIDPYLQLPMQRLAGTDLFYASFRFHPQARLTYRFVKDFEEVLTDPRNPLKGPSLFGGQVSILEMPGYPGEPADLSESPAPKADSSSDTDAAQGRLETWDFSSPFWRTSRRVSVLLPPGYEEDSEGYPVIFFNYGQGLLQTASMQERLEAFWAGPQAGPAGRSGAAATAAGDHRQPLPPFIAVFVQAISPREYARSERDEHVRMMTEGLLPEIERRYRTRPWRAVLGMLEGGYGALYTALQRPDVFAAAASMSARPIGDGDQRLLQLAESAQPLPRIYLSWGIYDFRSPSRDENAAAFNRRLSALLKKLPDARRQAVEKPHGSDLPTWIPRLREALAFLLRGL